MKQSDSVLRTALIAAGLTWLGLEAVRRLQADDLRGEVVLITGGSRGLGFLLARELGFTGCRVAICARDQHELEYVIGKISKEGARLCIKNVNTKVGHKANDNLRVRRNGCPIANGMNGNNNVSPRVPWRNIIHNSAHPIHKLAINLADRDNNR